MTGKNTSLIFFEVHMFFMCFYALFFPMHFIIHFLAHYTLKSMQKKKLHKNK